MLGLAAQPIAGAETVLRPGEDRLVFKPPGVQDDEGLAHVMVGRPQPQNAILVRERFNLLALGADLGDRHLRIGMSRAVRRILLTQFVGPGRVGDDDAIGAAAGIGRLLGADRLGLAGDLEPLEWPVDAPRAVHVGDELAEALGLGFGGAHDGKPLFDLRVTFAEHSADDFGGAPINLCQNFGRGVALRF
jgi:hypothetical protein